MKMTRKGFLAGASAFAASGLTPVFAEGDSPELAAGKRWFRQAQFGMMVHWGLYSLLGGEWKGARTKHPYSEWVMHSGRIPLKEYAALASAFNPILFDPLDWMSRARDAGMKYFVITSKHHDGFALYRSKGSKYNVVDATPFKRDIVGEIAEACRKTGVKLGLYYSQDLDWSEMNGGGNPGAQGGGQDWGKVSWWNDWDWPADRKYDFAQYFEGKCKPQVKEILTQYGDLCLIWFDVPVTISKAQAVELKDMVRKYQPGCLINGRLGFELGDYSTPYDNQVLKESDGRLLETVGTMNDSWGYRPTDTNYRSVQKIREIKAQCASIGANYMLNVGPDPMGRFPVAAISILDGLKVGCGPEPAQTGTGEVQG